MRFLLPKSAALLALLLPVLALACSSEPAGDADETEGALEQQHGAHWSYQNAESWHELDEAWAVCKSGQRQSPIDITRTSTKADDALAALQFEYAALPLNILNNGHTVQVNGAPAGTTAPKLRANGKTYALAQFHFHAGSEHTFDGKRSALELHLVHKNVADPNDLAVVGVLFEEGTESVPLRDVFKNAPRGQSEEKSVARASVDLPSLVSKDSAYVTYPGSLTTPPCSETVSWYVLTTPQQVSKAQLAAYRAAVPGVSYRPTQDLHGRAPRSFAARN